VELRQQAGRSRAVDHQCGGTAVSGGTTASGGSNMAMQALVKAMAPGWNLGNSFDGSPKRDQLGKPRTQTNPDQRRARSGFQSPAAPCHLGPPPWRRSRLHHRCNVDGPSGTNGAVGRRRGHVRLRRYAPRCLGNFPHRPHPGDSRGHCGMDTDRTAFAVSVAN